MKCNQRRPGFELVSPCPFPTMITITPRAPADTGCVWEGVGGRTKTATYWPPLFWLSQPFFPVLLGCSTEGLGDQPLLGHGSHSSIFSPTYLNFLSSGLYNNLPPTYFLWASQFALNSTPRQSRSPPEIFDRMHQLFTQVHFFFWQLGQGQYVTKAAVYQYGISWVSDNDALEFSGLGKLWI